MAKRTNGGITTVDEVLETEGETVVLRTIDNGGDVLVNEVASDGGGSEETGLQVNWLPREDGGYDLIFGGQARIVIDEKSTADGVVYTSDVFAKGQDDLRDAIALAVKNLASRTFVQEWKRRNPTPVKTTTTRVSKAAALEERTDRLEAMMSQALTMLAKQVSA